MYFDKRRFFTAAVQLERGHVRRQFEIGQSQPLQQWYVSENLFLFVENVNECYRVLLLAGSGNGNHAGTGSSLIPRTPLKVNPAK